MSTVLTSSTDCRSTRLQSVRKLTAANVREIRSRYFSGHWTATELGIMFGVTTQNIYLIVNFKTWRYV
jgi:hypothetical protein